MCHVRFIFSLFLFLLCTAVFYCIIISDYSYNHTQGWNIQGWIIHIVIIYRGVLPSTPASGHRLVSSRMAQRRQFLRPMENPRTPALVPIDDGIRGYKLSTSSSSAAAAAIAAGQSSPPSSAYARHTQLPPLEVGGVVISTTGPSHSAGVAIHSVHTHKSSFRV